MSYHAIKDCFSKQSVLQWVRMHYWLLKSEPSTFGITDLCKSTKQTTAWEGVRNCQARNFMRAMKKGDLAFFYHSSCKEPAIVGIVRVVTEAYPDATAQNPASQYYDPKSTDANPRWYNVNVKLVQTLENPVTLATIRQTPSLKHMRLVQRGNRLSITPVTEKEWKVILNLADL